MKPAPPEESYGAVRDLSTPEREALVDVLADALPEVPRLVVQPPESVAESREAATDGARAGALARPPPGDDQALASMLDEPDPGFVVEAFDQAFAIELSEDGFGALIEVGYLSGGWTGVDEVVAALETSLQRERPEHADALRRFIAFKTDSIGLLAGDYLLELERESLRLLGVTLDERLAVARGARAAILEGEGAGTRLRRADGALPERTTRLLGDLDKVRSARADLHALEQEFAPAEMALIVLRLAASAKLAVDQLPPDEVDPGDVVLLRLLSPVLADELRDAVRRRRALVAAARALVAEQIKALMAREQAAVLLVTPATEEIPKDEAEIARRFDERLTELTGNLERLKGKLDDGSLSAFQARLFDQSAVHPTGRPGVVMVDPRGFIKTGAEAVRLGKPGSKPDRALAGLLIARWSDDLRLPFTVWSMGPVVQRADRNLRARGSTSSTLAPAVYASLQQELIRGQVAQAKSDIGLSLFVMAAIALSGPAAPLLITMTLLADIAEAAAVTERYAEEQEVAAADVDIVGDAGTVRALLDRAPDMSVVMMAWLSVLSGGADVAARGVRALAAGTRVARTAVPILSTLATRFAQAGVFVAVASAAEGLDTEPTRAPADAPAANRPGGAP